VSGSGRARSLLLLDRLDGARAWAALPIRLFLGGFLIYMSHDNVFSAARMEEFVQFLAGNGFPLPEVAARLSVWAQFVCGGLIIIGLATRWAAALMVVNFVIAIAGVHLSLPLRTWLEPCAMLAAALMLLLHGAGPLSIDERVRATR
jgi:putative oxidoreductase